MGGQQRLITLAEEVDANERDPSRPGAADRQPRLRRCGTSQSSPFQPLGGSRLALRDWGGHVVLDVSAFSISALILDFALHRASLVARWLSVWV